jgi:hypothetical protein
MADGVHLVHQTDMAAVGAAVKESAPSLGIPIER